MDLQVQPNSSATKRNLGQDEGCRRKSVKKDQGHQIEQTKGGLPESGHHPTNGGQPVSRSSECPVKDLQESPVKDSQIDKVVVTISKDGLMLRVLLNDHVPYMCPLCGWTFTHAASLKQHGKDVHGYEEAEKIQNGGRGKEIIITKSRVDQSNVLESCFLKDMSLPREDTPKSPGHQPCNTCTLKDTLAATEKVVHNRKVATQEIVVENEKSVPEKAAHKEHLVHNEKVALEQKVAHKEKVVPKEKVATKEKVAPKAKVAHKKKVTPKKKVGGKGKIMVKLSVKPKRGSKNTRDTGNRAKVHGGCENSVKSGKSPELGIASLLLQALGRKKEADDVIEMQTSSQKADFEKQKPRRKNMRAVSGLSTESTSCVASEGSLPSDEDLCMTEKEGSGKRKRRKYRPKCSICGFKCDSITQRYAHSAKVHLLFRNVKEASTFKSKHLDQLQGDRDSPKADQTRPEPVLHKCPHCTSCSFDPDMLQGHLGSHCGAAKGMKCHLCAGAIELWDNDRCEELEALSNKLQEIEDDDQGSGWDQITFSNDGSWSWTGTTSSYSRSLEDDDSGEGVLTAEDGDAPPADNREQQQEGQNKSIPRSRRIKAYPPFVSSCYECGEKFFFRAHAMNHYHHAHRSLTCRDCSTVVPSLTALISHSLQEHKSRGVFRCTHCTQAFHTAGKLHYHLEGHLGLFKCTACDKSFMTLNAMDLHTANYCPASKEKRAQSLKPITCSICKLDFVRKHAYYKHMSRWHPDKGVEIQLKDKTTPLVCDRCGKFYCNSTTLKTHMKTHQSASPHCSKTFHADKNLSAGVSSDQMDLEYICDLCGKTFRSSALLKSHRKRHLGVLPFKCRFCGKGFIESRRKILHEWSIHTGECMHKCEVCGKSYATATGLKTHWNTHSSVRPFKCSFCEASFVDKFSLESHLRTHIKPFHCVHCGEVFAQKGGRRRHLFRAHGISEPVPRFRMKIFATASSSSQLQGIAEPDRATQLESEKAASIQNNEKS